MTKTTMTYRVPYADTDQMGVVFYGNYLTLLYGVKNGCLYANWDSN